MQSNLTVILPAYNEEEVVGLVIDEIRSLPVHYDILVVDNHSTDNTYKVALSKGVKVINEPTIGKGNAMKTGFRSVNSSHVAMMNSDHTYPAVYLEEVSRLLSMGYDVVVGYRRWKEQGSMGLLNSFGNRILSLLGSLLYRKRIRDVCSGMWGFRKEVLDKFDLRSEEFTLEAELFTESRRHGCMMAQIPICYRSRHGNSRAKLKVWDGFKIAWFLIENKWKK